MKLLSSVFVACCLALSIGLGVLACHYTAQAARDRLEQENISIKFKYRQTDIKLRRLWSEYLNLRIEYENLLPRSIPQSAEPIIKPSDKEC
jgi:TRAP-type C4-dicarboxylate transport system permease small subunit